MANASHKASATPRTPDMNRWMLYENIGKRIRALRIARNKTAGQLGAEAGTTQTTMSKIEAGETPPPVHVLVGAARALGVTLNDIVPPEWSLLEAKPVDVLAPGDLLDDAARAQSVT